MTLTEEHVALRAVTREFLAARFPVDRIASGGAPPLDGWATLTDLGWWGRDVGALERALIAEECGYALLPLPWRGQLALGGRVDGVGVGPVALAPVGVPSDLRAEPAAGGVLLSGTACGVPDAGAATLIAVVAGTALGPALVLAAPAGADVRAEPGLDTLRPSSRVTFTATPATVPAADLTGVRRRSDVLLAAEAVGVARRAYDMAIDYAGTRTQFGKVIGAYQGIAFAIADSYMNLELARSLVFRAAWLTEAAATDGSVPDEVVETAVAGAVVAARAAATESCERALQVFGGLGMTWENPLHHWYRRALWIDSFDRSSRTQLDRIATAVLGA